MHASNYHSVSEYDELVEMLSRPINPLERAKVLTKLTAYNNKLIAQMQSSNSHNPIFDMDLARAGQQTNKKNERGLSFNNQNEMLNNRLNVYQPNNNYMPYASPNNNLTYDPRPPTYDPRPPTYDPRPPTYDPRQPAYDPRPPTYDPRPPTYDPRPPAALARSVPPTPTRTSSVSSSETDLNIDEIINDFRSAPAKSDESDLTDKLAKLTQLKNNIVSMRKERKKNQ